jgi:hypothetical protein
MTSEPAAVGSTEPDVASRSIGELIGEVAKDLSTLMRQELELAKSEIKTEATKAGKGAGMLGGAGVAAHLVLIFLSVTVIFALDGVIGAAWSALLVTVVWAIVAAVLAASGRKKLKDVNPKPEQTVESLKEDARWIKAQNS